MKYPPNTFRGWTIRYSPPEPVTGRWTATRRGVRLCAESWGTLHAALLLRGEWGPAPVNRMGT